MARVKGLWEDSVQRVGDDFIAGKIHEVQFRSRMKRLGFDLGEIREHLLAAKETKHEESLANSQFGVGA